MKTVRNALVLSITILIAATAFFTVGLVAGGFAGYQVATPATPAVEATEEIPDAQEEYYRGIYDICLKQTHQISFCLKTVEKLKNSSWHEKPSSGWEWPLKTNNTTLGTGDQNLSGIRW